MKKTFVILLLLSVLANVIAQNGFTSFLNPITSFSTKTSIKVDPSGNKWYSTTTRGVYKFDGLVWINYDTTNSSIPSNAINDITFDAAGNAWFASRKGVSKFDGTSWTTYNKLNSGLPSDSTYCIYIQASDIWIGTKQGLAKFNGSIWTIYNTSNSGLINNYVTALNINSAGDIWIGTNKGLSVKTSTGWTSYSDHNTNFVNSQVQSIYFEDPSKVWISVNGAGLFKFENNIFFPMQNCFLDKRVTISTKTITKGPQGGILVCAGFSGLSGFVEILGEQVYFYQAPSFLYSSYCHIYDYATNIVWFIKQSGNYLYSFDYSDFTGAILVPDDPRVTYLDVNQVKAGLLNRGDMHWDLENSACYEVPKNSGRNAIFNSALWIGGLDNGGNLHQAAMTYRAAGEDYWAGPLDTINGTIDSATSIAYDKIWKLDRWEIEEFKTMFANGSVTAGTYIPVYNITSWPAQGSGNFSRNLAPFVDVNGDGLYKPLIDGDYPKIKGDQMCYWIFNDNLTHSETGGIPLNVEVHASAYAYTCDEIADSMSVLNYTTFYSYDIYNRSLQDYHDVYLGVYSLHRLGGYNDDYTGSNSSGNYSFEYNGDGYDESYGSIFGYGDSPPILSKVILNGPLSEPNDSIDNNNDGIIDEANEKNLMTHYHCWVDGGGPANSDPTDDSGYYNLMQSIWNDAVHVTYGDDGIGGTVPYNFTYDGVPGDSVGWSLWNMAYPFMDYRMVTSTGPFNLNVGQKVNFDFAYVFTRDQTAATYDITDLYYKNWDDVKRIQRWYAADSFPSCDPGLPTNVLNTKSTFNELKLYPNPASSFLFIDYKSDAKTMIVEIYDVRGQLLKQENFNSLSKQALNISDLSKGLYLLKVSDGKSVQSQRFIKQ